ncbi:uncharacterized protein LOC131952406 [Physella acuta]|uniref:uncharacterized protein LOC131952406 n=1 Tax=Physella acuta TaxID=109671 RepID=UPI0027DC8450|nr:uncharacterized protein LOC131952406 [Physella acuta]
MENAITQAPKETTPTLSPVQTKQPTRAEVGFVKSQELKFSIPPKVESSRILNDKRFPPSKTTFIAKKQSDHDKGISEQPTLPSEKNLGSNEPEIAVSRKSEEQDHLKRLTNDYNPRWVNQEKSYRQLSSPRCVLGQAQLLAQTNEDECSAQDKGIYVHQGGTSLGHRSDVTSSVDISNIEPEVKISNTATHQTMDEFKKVAHRSKSELKTSPQPNDSPANTGRETSSRSRQVAGPEILTREFRTLRSVGTNSESSSKLPAQTDELSSKLPAQTGELSSKLPVQTDELSSKLPAQTGELSSKLPAQTGELSSIQLSKTDELSSKLPARTDELSSIQLSKTDELSSKLPAQTDELSSKLPAQTGELSSKLPAQTDELSSKLPAQTGELSSKLPAQTGELSSKLPAQTGELSSIQLSKTDELSSIQLSKTDELSSIQLSKTDELYADEKEEFSFKLSAKKDELNSKPAVEKEEFNSKLAKIRELNSKLAVEKEELNSKLVDVHDKIGSKLTSKARELSSKRAVDKEELNSKLADETDRLGSQLTAKTRKLNSKLAVGKEDLGSKLSAKTDELNSKQAAEKEEVNSKHAQIRELNLKQAVEKEELSLKRAATTGDLSSKPTAPTCALSSTLPTATGELRPTQVCDRMPTSAAATQWGNSHQLSTQPARQNKQDHTEDGTYFIQDTFSGSLDRENDEPNSDVSKRDASRSHRLDSDISNQTICVSSEPFHSIWAVPSLSSSLASHHKVNIQASFFSKKINERCLRMKSNVVDRTEQCKLNLKRKYYSPSAKCPGQTSCRRCHSLPELGNNHLDKSFNAPVSFDDTSLQLTLKSKTCLDFPNFQRGKSTNKSIRIQKQSLHTRLGEENAVRPKTDKQYRKVNKLEDFLLAEELKQQNGLSTVYSRLRLELDQTSSPSSTTDLDLNYQCQTKFVEDAIKSLEQRTKRKLDHFRRNSSDDSSLDDSDTATTNTLSSRRTSLCNNSSAFIRQDARPPSLFSSRRLDHNSPSPPQPGQHQLREIGPSSSSTQGRATGNPPAQVSTTQACRYQVNQNHTASYYGRDELTPQNPVHVDSSFIGSSLQSDNLTPLLEIGGCKPSYDKRRVTEASTKEAIASTAVNRPEEGASKTTKANVANALEIPVDIYTVPLWRPLKTDQSQKKSKKKKDGVATRTVVISGPLSNFTIPVKRHFKEQLAATADDAGVRPVEVDGTLPEAKDVAPPAHHAPLPATEPADDQKRGWIGKVRKILPFRKKEKSPKKK